MQYVVEIQVDQLVAKLNSLLRTIDHPQPMLESYGETLLRVNQQRHSQGLAPDGSAWQALSPLTLATKRKSQILYDHGDLLRFQYKVSGDSLRVGTSDWKAVFHHFGTKPYTITPVRAKALRFAGIVTKRVQHPGLPKRELVGFPPSDQRLVADITTDHLALVMRST